jgi:AcrR family transcriptional regulator
MAVVVEHEKRRREILEKALDVFVTEGFENATYQKIADRCGITRTTLYLYFRNKREIFNFSIKQLMGKAETDLIKLRENAKLSHPEKLKRMLFLILDTLEKNRRLLSVILDYLMFLAKSSPGAINSRVQRRTVRLRRLLANMVIDGIKAGEIKKVDIRAADTLLYGIIETAIFHLAVLKQPSAADVRDTVELAMRQLTV